MDSCVRGIGVIAGNKNNCVQGYDRFTRVVHAQHLTNASKHQCRGSVIHCKFPHGRSVCNGCVKSTIQAGMGLARRPLPAEYLINKKFNQSSEHYRIIFFSSFLVR